MLTLESQCIPINYKISLFVLGLNWFLTILKLVLKHKGRPKSTLRQQVSKAEAKMAINAQLAKGHPILGSGVDFFN